MIEAYEIGVSLVLNDAITGSLSAVYDVMGKIDGEVDDINAALVKTGGLVGDLVGAVGGLTGAFNAATSAANALKDASAGIGAGSGAAAPPTGPLPGETPYYMPGDNPPAGGGGSNLPATIPGQPYYSGDDGNTYRGSSYAPNWTPGTEAGSPPDDAGFNEGPVRMPLMPGGGGRADGAHVGLSEVFFANALATAGLNVISDLYNTVADPQQQITRMRLSDKNFSEDDADKVMAAAKALVMQVPGMSLTGALTIIAGGFKQTRAQGMTVEQSVNAAIAMSLPLAKDAAVLHAGGDDAAVNQIMDLQRAAELAGTLNDTNPDGSINMTRFDQFTDIGTRASMSVPGVDPHQILLQVQQNDVGAMANDTEGQSYDEILISALGGYKSGTGLAALNREFTGGKMSTGTEGVLVKLGLIDPAGATKTGQYYTLRPGALVGQELFDADPVKWLETVFTPAVERLSPDDRGAMLHDIYSGTGTASGARVAGDAVLQDAFIARQQYDAQQLTPTINQSIADLRLDPKTAAAGAANSIADASNTILGEKGGWAVSLLDNFALGAEDFAAHPLSALGTMLNPFNYGMGSLLQTPSMPGGPPPIPTPPFVEEVKGFLSGLITGMVKDIVGAVDRQGSSPQTALYVTWSGMMNIPMTPHPTAPTQPNVTQTPPNPGGAYRFR